MTTDLDSAIEEYLRMMFGDMVRATIKMQKKKLGLNGKSDLSRDEYLKLADEIRKVCVGMSGEEFAAKIYDGLIKIIEKKSNQAS
ncbi:MAG: hypothetical protein N3F63_01405 [Thermoplasmata archaeon]|nr:hypothetical protein [Thermoplasmata archaeon]